MPNPHLLLCNGANLSTSSPEWASVAPQELWTSGQKKNVTIEITHITDPVVESLPDVVKDLVELAAIVYAADQCCKRTGPKSFDYGDKWHRHFRFEVGVRRPDFWKQRKVLDALVETLTFLSDDNYEFAFSKWKNPPKFTDYLPDFQKSGSPPNPPERVMLFSGGLDSLAGAVDEVLVNKRRVAMVSHKPVDHLAVKQREIMAEIARRVGAPQLAPLHFPVKANKDGELSLDYTQRSRSFLYASMAAAVARLFNLDRIYFYENGLLSVNLPLCGQEVGGRATRTTHPQALHGFGRIFSLVLGRPFTVENEFLWLTKQDVLERLKGTQHVDLAKMSLSCTHTRNFTLAKPHCGLCSQCISRRVAALGADYGDNDPGSGYRADVLTAPRDKDEDRIVAERFIGVARQVEAMADLQQFHQMFAGELSRVTPYLPFSSSDAVAKLFALHHHHAVQVGQTMLKQMNIYLNDFRMGQIPDTSAIGYAFSQGHVSATKALKKTVSAQADEGVKPKVAQELVNAMRAFLKKHPGKTYTAKELNTEMKDAGLITRGYHSSDISAAKRYLVDSEHLPLVGRSYRYEDRQNSK